MRLAFLTLLIAYCNGIIAQPKFPPNVYCEESYEDLKHRKDSTYYPTLAENEKLMAILQQKATYPELAKKMKHSAVVVFEFLVDAKGKVSDLNILSDPYPLFDTNAVRLILTTSEYWKPAIRQDKPTDIKITTAIVYQIKKQSDGTLRYTSTLLGTQPIVLETSQNSPACLQLIENQDTTFLYKSRMMDGSSVAFVQGYGTVTVGFDVDTFGLLTNIKIINSVSPELDYEAQRFIESTKGKWTPAFRQGIKVESHVDFDINFFLHTQTKLTTGVGLYTPTTMAHVLDRKTAFDFYESKDYKLAFQALNKLCKYYIHDPEIFFMRGMCHVQFEKMDKACDDLNYAMYLAGDMGFPESINKEKMMEFVGKYCGRSEE